MLTLFLTEAALGSVLAMSAVPVRAAGRLFFRYGSAQSCTLILIGLGLGGVTGTGTPTSRILFTTAAILLLVAAGLFHVQRARAASLLLFASVPPSLAGCLIDVWSIVPAGGALARLAWAGDAISASLVTGSVLMAMILGHYYLNIPGLSSVHLERLACLAMGAIAARACVLVVNVATHRDAIAPLISLLFDTSGAAPWNGGLDPFVIVLLLIQAAFGLGVPVVFAFMAWRSARIASTQSATGILYVALIMVIMGELAGRYVVTLTRLPI